MKQDPTYVSAFDLLDQGRILEYKDLCGAIQGEDYSKLDWKHPTDYSVDPLVFDRIAEIAPYLKEPKYHIIRTSHSCYHDLTILNFKQVFPNADFLSETEFDVILDQVLQIKPSRHTFIFIKEKLRCAKTLQKDYLGILYERYTKKPKMDTILQGLVGRLTGYHKNHDAVVFSNPTLVQNYRDQWDKIFEGQETSRQKPIFIGQGTSF
jgi:hypothetical protein